MKDLTEIASISGKGGLFRIIKPGRVGVILESMDSKKIKIATNPNHKVSILADISIYTTTEEGSRPLDDILRKIHQEFGNDPGIDGKSTPEEFISFIEYIVPEYDPSRVYPSDVRKLVSWYKILLKENPEFFIAEKEKKKEKTETSENAGETGGTTRKSKKETEADIEDPREPNSGPNLETAAKKKDGKKDTPKKKS
jgi:hypothetical protein